MKITKRLFAVIGLAALLSGCATAAFDPPPSYYSAPGKVPGDPVPLDPTNQVHVLSYLRGATDTFDRLLKNADRLKHATELPIIGAGVFAPTWLALGRNTDGAIYAAGAGAAGGALSSYLGLRDRSATVALARSAVTCIGQRYIEQVMQGRAVAVALTNAQQPGQQLTAQAIQGAAAKLAISDSTTEVAAAMIGPAAPVAGDVFGAGSVALVAVDNVISSLKVRLAKMGQVPDYAAILSDLQSKQKIADAKKPSSASGFVSSNRNVETLVDSLAEYEVKIAQCAAKLP